MESEVLPVAPANFDGARRVALIAGGVGVLLCALGWFVQPSVFLRSYLWAYCFWLGLALGSFVLALLQWLTGGVWGLVLRRYLEAATRTLPLLAVLFLPIAFGLGYLYLWADPAKVAADHNLQHKALYLNPTFFLIRAALYFVVWSGIAFLLGRWSRSQDRSDAPDAHHMRVIGAVGLLVYGLTITLAAVDWVMSLEPNWISTIFGVLFGVGQILSAMAFATAGVVVLIDKPPFAGVIGRAHLRDFGQLLLAFVMVWAYMAISQFLLMWSGNLPSEIPYYLRRLQGGWQYLGLGLILLQFTLPFLLLLSADVKRDARKLLFVAGLVLVMRMVDLFWMVSPARPGLDAAPFTLSWTDIAAPVAIGGLWLALFLTELGRYRLLPEYDPLLAEAIHHE